MEKSNKGFEMIIDAINAFKNDSMVENFKLDKVSRFLTDDDKFFTRFEVSYDIPMFGYTHKGVSTLDRELTVDEWIIVGQLQGNRTLEYDETDKDDIQEIIQHFRPSTFGYEWYPEAFDTKNGVTLRMVINHTLKQAELFASVCTNDTFSKSEGIRWTREPDHKIAEQFYQDEPPTMDDWVSFTLADDTFLNFRNFISKELHSSKVWKPKWSINATN